MIVEINFPIKVRIDASKIQSLHDSLVKIRDAARSTNSKTVNAELGIDELDAIIQPLADKLQILDDRKLLIRQAQEEDEERIRLIRSGTAGTS